MSEFQKPRPTHVYIDGVPYYAVCECGKTAYDYDRKADRFRCIGCRHQAIKKAKAEAKAA